MAAEDARKLQGICRLLTKVKGEAVLMHGEPVPGMYIVGEGAVGVYPPGAQRPLVTLGAGEAFGEMSFLEKSRASATIRAEDKITRLIVIQHGDLSALLDAEPRVGYSLYQGIAFTLSKKLRTTTSKIAGELAKGHHLLSDLAARSGSEDLSDLPGKIAAHATGALDALGKVEIKLDELCRRYPDRVGSLSDLVQHIADAKAHCRSFVPNISEQVRIMEEFVRSMETFLEETTSR
jgi:CRP-like cAMP-binding protein